MIEKFMMVACGQLIFVKSCMLPSYMPRKTQPQGFPGKSYDAWREHGREPGREHLAKVGQSERGGLIDSSGSGLLSQLDFFLEISFPA